MERGTTLRIVDRASASEARNLVRTRGAEIGLPEVAFESLAVAVSELANNQLAHARDGEIRVDALERDGVPGLEVIASDGGGGIRDPASALGGLGASHQGLGIGLAGVRRMADEVDFDVRLEEGTTIAARKFAGPVRRFREVGVMGRPFHGERRNGDHGAFVRRGPRLVAAICDGLGHGHLARRASDRVIGAFRRHADAPLLEIMEACDAAAEETRGAVLGLLGWDEDTRELTFTGMGNVGAMVVRPFETKRFLSAPGVLGGSHHIRRRRRRVEHLTLERRDVVVLYTDGLRSNVRMDQDPAVLRRPPVLIAQHLLEEHTRPHDDALLFVMR
ncbi:MAG: SpoIIE family protein phosphatase [Myxococcota bacterium]